MNYRPRNDIVVIKVVDKGKVRGIAMPDVAQEGKERIILAVGPKVEDLKVGDKVLVIGTPGQDLVRIPGELNLFLTKEVNVLVVVVEDE